MKVSPPNDEILIFVLHPAGDSNVCSAVADEWAREAGRKGLKTKRIDIADRRGFGEENTDVRTEKDPGVYNTRIRVCVEPRWSSQGYTALRRGLSKSEPLEGQKFCIEEIEKARFLVFCHPIWWMDAPGFAKTFIESVCLPGSGYTTMGGAMTKGALCLVDCMTCWSFSCWPSTLDSKSAMHGFYRDKEAIIVETLAGPRNGPVMTGRKTSSIKMALRSCGISTTRLCIQGVANPPNEAPVNSWDDATATDEAREQRQLEAKKLKKDIEKICKRWAKSDAENKKIFPNYTDLENSPEGLV